MPQDKCSTVGGPCASTLLHRVIDYENGELETEAEVIDLFQDLINSGLVWQLQGHYGRFAKYLIENGDCHLPVGGIKP